MFANHISHLTSAYCHDELLPEQSRQVAEHLISCPRCRAEFEEVKLGMKAAAQLPLVPAPASIWREIETALDRRDQPAKIRERRWTISFIMQPRFVVPAFAAMALLAVFAAFWMHRPSTPVRTVSTWNVARLDGTPQIGTTPVVDNNGKLAVGQWLVTDSSSRAKIDVASIGHVEIDPGTRVRLLETNPSEHRLELARGRLSAYISAPPKIFFVDTPSAIAEDLGCAYTLAVDDDGNSLLRVTAGWVALHLRDRESVVPAGAACATRPGIGPGTPYFEDASEYFRQALAKLDFEPNDTQWSKIPALDIVLHEARPRDTMTLWHLLSRVNDNDRPRLYDRMARLVPPPEGVTRDGVLRLDKEMLNRWREEIDGHSFSLPEAVRDVLGRIRSGVHRKAGALHGR